MSNKVSFLFVAQDRYSKVVAKAARATKKFNKEVIRLPGRLRLARMQLNKLRVAAVGFGKGMKSAGQKLTLFATAPILLLANSMTNAARDAVETQSKFDTVFKGMETKANKMADELAKSYIFAKDEARELLGNTGDLLNGFGLTGDAALKMSVRVQQAAADLNSFKNFSGGAAGASAILTKALLGERESLKSLGITFNEEDVKRKIQTLAAKGMTFATKGQAKAQATLALILEKSKNSIGDVAKTSHELAAQERRLMSDTRDLRVEFGQQLLPIKLKIVSVLSKLVGWFSTLSPATKKIILITVGLIAVLGPLLIIFGGIVAALPLVIAGFVLLTGPIGLVIAGVTALIAGFIALRENWDAVVDVVGGTITQAGANIADFFGAKDTSIELNKRIDNIVTSKSRSQSDVNIGITAPQGVVQSVKQKTTGKAPGLNVGVNMAVAQ